MRLPVVSVALALTAFACAPQDDSDDPIAEDSHSPEAALDDIASGKADSATCSGIITPDQGDFGYRVALTFDDGPALDSTPLVLDVLKKHHASATFFTVGNALNSPQARALVQRMLDEGHMVGSHSNSHPNFKAISTTSQMNEITRSEAALAAAGITAPHWFRFPYGNGTCAGIDRVHHDGMTVVGWQFGSDDWCFNAGHGYCSPSSYAYMPTAYRHDQIGWIRHEVARNHGGIMLNHDSHMYTAQHLDEWLTLMEGMGYTFVRLDDASIFPRLNGITPPPPPFVGTACTDDSTCSFSNGATHGACYAFDADDTLSGFCTLSCQGTCPDKTGAAPTFCATIDGAGMCASKAGALNNNCAKIPGTTPRAIARFVGSSGAAAATATVCVP